MISGDIKLRLIHLLSIIIWLISGYTMASCPPSINGKCRNVIEINNDAIVQLRFYDMDINHWSWSLENNWRLALKASLNNCINKKERICRPLTVISSSSSTRAYQFRDRDINITTPYQSTNDSVNDVIALLYLEQTAISNSSYRVFLYKDVLIDVINNKATVLQQEAKIKYSFVAQNVGDPRPSPPTLPSWLIVMIASYIFFFLIIMFLMAKWLRTWRIKKSGKKIHDLETASIEKIGNGIAIRKEEEDGEDSNNINNDKEEEEKEEEKEKGKEEEKRQQQERQHQPSSLRRKAAFEDLQDGDLSVPTEIVLNGCSRRVSSIPEMDEEDNPETTAEVYQYESNSRKQSIDSKRNMESMKEDQEGFRIEQIEENDSDTQLELKDINELTTENTDLCNDAEDINDKSKSSSCSTHECGQSSSFDPKDIEEKSEINGRNRTLTGGSKDVETKVSQLRRGSLPIGKVLHELRSKLSVKRRHGRDGKHKGTTFQPMFRKLDGNGNSTEYPTLYFSGRRSMSVMNEGINVENFFTIDNY
ncbi:hypothetical protein TrispH2_007010 [Trichoplax sp. H2]|nr:hypothetical protein TrispH2_007010 [Trichoplax sp. H2]|eukprot:RDD39804.1 hypothetical protein TrispH2_007010 [Trichoplax sp. H2]